MIPTLGADPRRNNDFLYRRRRPRLPVPRAARTSGASTPATRTSSATPGCTASSAAAPRYGPPLPEGPRRRRRRAGSGSTAPIASGLIRYERAVARITHSFNPPLGRSSTNSTTPAVLQRTEVIVQHLPRDTHPTRQAGRGVRLHELLQDLQPQGMPQQARRLLRTTNHGHRQRRRHELPLCSPVHEVNMPLKKYFVKEKSSQLSVDRGPVAR